MADRYWVGGTGTWDGTSTTNWSASSGGATGASVPTAADNVFFDVNSNVGTGSFTVTMATTPRLCNDFTASGLDGAMTLAGSNIGLTVSGSLTFQATNFIRTYTGTTTFNATTTGKTVTTNGVSIGGAVDFNGVGGVWTLGSALDVSANSLVVTTGTFNTSTNNYAISCGTFSSSNSNIRTINLNASTLTLSSTTPWAMTTSTNATLNTGTSTINCTYAFASSTTFAGGGQTFYNVAFTSTAITTAQITGVNTFNNLSVTGPAATGVANLTFFANQTINGTLSTTGTAGSRRVFFSSETYGIGRTLTVNSAPSLTDADFRDIYVIGTAAPISGTRIGNRGNNSGITFDVAKTVFWNLAGSQNWSANAWATTSTGTPSTDNFPLPQDTATFTNAGSVTGTITFDSAITFKSSVDMSARTTAMTLAFTNATTWYGNWTNGSGTTLSGTATQTLSGGTTQTITSAGKTFSCSITVDTYNGTVQLADALNIGSNNLVVTNGTFNTSGFAVAASGFFSASSNVRTINLGASTVTLNAGVTPVNFALTNLTFNAGTSTFSMDGSNTTFVGGGLTFYNVTFTSVSFNFTYAISGANTFNNLTFTAASSTGNQPISIQANQTINGTLTFAGASETRRRFVHSSTVNTQITLTVNSLSADYCDFRDIVIAGAASGSSPTNAGDCGGNSGITFPAPKTVYWNLAGTQNFTATGWATSSGGTPAVGNFPLAQDTAIFDNTGAAGTVTLQTTGASNFWNFGTIDASLRTSAMTLTNSASMNIYGDWKYGTGVTSGNTNSLYFSKNGTQTITSNGVTFGFFVRVANPAANVQLTDALSTTSAGGILIDSGTFNAVAYNVTAGLVNNSVGSVIRMGSGTWTLSGTGTVWGNSSTIFSGTANIVLSDTSTTARSFNGNGAYYNKLTIGGATGISTLTVNGSNTFGELASTKTVAHTISFANSTLTTFGKWSVTGTVGNVVTITTPGISNANIIAGPAVTGINYLAISNWAISSTSPGEFYAGANSTGTAAAPVFLTAAPPPRTLYWVGGTGSWGTPGSWSMSSGGGSGVPIPTSLDTVIFDSASNPTAYTATVVGGGIVMARCAAFTMAGPASGNVTFAGTVQIAFHGSVLFAATGITRSYSGAMNWAGNASYTFTTNGLALSNTTTINGVGATWTLGSALNVGTGIGFTVTNGTLDTSSVGNYAFTVGNQLSSNNSNVRTINLNASTVTIGSNIPIVFTATNLTFNAGTSQMTFTTFGNFAFNGASQTFYNVSFTNFSIASLPISGANTFNNLSFPAKITLGIYTISISANQTINGTLTIPAGSGSAYRTQISGNNYTLTCASVSLTDVDFKNTTIAGAASPASGTRLGDGKGNSGITFPAAKTVYFRSFTSWADSWAATSGGTPNATLFPLAQDTAVINDTYPPFASTVSIGANYNIGTIDMSLRTIFMTLTTSSNAPSIYGNWINGTGASILGTSVIVFEGRTAQTITSAGKTFTQNITISSPSGSVTLQDNLTTGTGVGITLSSGTLDLNNFTLSTGVFSSSGSATRTLTFGSGTISLTGTGNVWNMSTSTNATINNGTGTIFFTDTSTTARTFAGGGLSYRKLSIGGASGISTLTISGNNTFGEIASTKTVANTISLAATTQRVGAWTATGTAGNLLTLTGTSAASPATLIYTGAGAVSGLDYLVPTSIRAYSPTTTWYAGANSTNGGTFGWIFSAFSGGTVYDVFIAETSSGIDTVVGYASFYSALQELASGIDQVDASQEFASNISETGSGIDQVDANFTVNAAAAETSSGIDSASSVAVFETAVSEASSGVDDTSALQTFVTDVAESASGVDQADAAQTFVTDVAESGSGIDQVDTSFTVNSNASETASGVDSSSSVGVFLTDVNEAASGIDSVSSAQTFITNVEEAGAGIDQVDASQDFSTNVEEAGAGIDQVDASQDFASNISEAGSGADEINASFTVNSDVLEAASGVDAISSFAVFPTSIDEAASGIDSISSAQTFATDVAETGSGLDQIDAAQSFATNVSEAGSGLDQLDAAQGFNSFISETASGLDEDSVAASTFNAFSEETASGIDNVSSNAAFVSDINETGSGIDAVSAKQTFSTNVDETGTGIDQVDATQTFKSSIAETASGVDADSVAASTFNAYAVETASGADSDSVAASTFNAYSDEAASGVDAINAKQGFGSAVVEEASGVDNISATQSFASSVSETGSGIDQVDSAQAFKSSISETASGVDSGVAIVTFNAFASETASGVDAVSSSASFGSAIDENASGVDAASSAQTFATNIAETAEGLDSTSVAASIFNAFLAETSSGVDSISSNPTFESSIAESASGIDSISSSATFASDIAETASGVDSILSTQNFAVFIGENASGLDVFTVAASIFNAAFTDFASGVDVNQPNFTYFSIISEGVSAQDFINSRYLWELIDNTETSDWGIINDTQTASWSQIDDTQALNWQNVGNTQTATWSQIDDAESGNWEQI